MHPPAQHSIYRTRQRRRRRAFTLLEIIVVVTMDFMSQMQAHMMSHQYDGLLKKANLRGGRR